MITVRYTKAQYMARITELEGYHGQLQQHLEKLEELRVFYKSAVEKLDGANLDVGQVLEAALGTLAGLGI